MGNFATLYSPIECPTCRELTPVLPWQFYYGDLSLLPKYSLGQEIDCGEGWGLVFAVAYPGAKKVCPRCTESYFLAEIEIRKDCIKNIHFLTFETLRSENLYLGEERVPWHERGPLDLWAESAAVRIQTAKYFKKMGGSATVAVPALRGISEHDPDSGVRLFAPFALWKIVGEPTTGYDAEWVVQVVRACLDDTDEEARPGAARILSEMGFS